MHTCRKHLGYAYFHGEYIHLILSEVSCLETVNHKKWVFLISRYSFGRASHISQDLSILYNLVGLNNEFLWLMLKLMKSIAIKC